MEPKVAQKKPYVQMEEPGDKTWCACGYSQTQPFCDGSHSRLNTGISPIRVTIPEKKMIAWCGCKHTSNKPFCDGTHSRM